MDSNLLSALIEKQIVQPGTEISVKLPGHDLSGITRVYNDVILEIQKIQQDKSNQIVLISSSTVDGRRYSIKSSHINMIDGMTPKKIGAIYNLRPDGTIKPPGKKRGRKAKNRTDE